MLDEQFLQWPYCSGWMVVHVVGIGLGEKYRISTIQANGAAAAAAYVEPALAAQHNVKNSPAGKIHVQPQGARSSARPKTTVFIVTDRRISVTTSRPAKLVSSLMPESFMDGWTQTQLL
jgi:hypothetical protein